MDKIKKNILEKILNNLSVNKGDNIYLGIDLFKVASELNAKKINRYKFVEQVLKFFLNKIGKNGSLIIPVFNFKCIQEKKFNQKNSIGESGALGTLLLKDYYQSRTDHPFYSFLCFGKKKSHYQKIKSLNATGKNSLWKYFIKDNFNLVTLGHHYSRSFTHVHYLERLAKVNYRYDKKFTFQYTDIYNKTKKKTYSLFVRKKNLCEYSAITKNCDQYLIKNNFVKFYRYKKLICFKMDIKSSSKVILDDLAKKSPNFVSVIKKNKKNNDIIGHENINRIEKMYMKKCI